MIKGLYYENDGILSTLHRGKLTFSDEHMVFTFQPLHHLSSRKPIIDHVDIERQSMMLINSQYSAELMESNAENIQMHTIYNPLSLSLRYPISLSSKPAISCGMKTFEKG